MKIDLGAVLRTTLKVNPKSHPRWDKLSKEDMFNRYTIPVREMLKRLLTKINMAVPSAEETDTILCSLVKILKKGERNIPVSKFKRNLKPYWCQTLNALKKKKVQVYKAWCLSGKPREGPLYRSHREAESAFRKKTKADQPRV